MASNIQHKICSRCNRDLQLSEFEPRKGASDGHRGVCKDCYTNRRYGRSRNPKSWEIIDGTAYKRCSGCLSNLEASLENFQAKADCALGINSKCRKCASGATMVSRKKCDPSFVRIREWRSKNRDLHNEYAKRTRLNRKDDPQRLAKHQKWRREDEREKRKDPKYRALQSIRTQISMVVHNKFDGKGLLRRLGYSRDDLIAHLEARFEGGMTWDNYGLLGAGWEIDHRKPCASFDFSDDEQIRECWALSNLQPMWASDNRSKGKKDYNEWRSSLRTDKEAA